MIIYNFKMDNRIDEMGKELKMAIQQASEYSSKFEEVARPY